MANLTGGGTPLPVYFRPRNILAATILPLTQNTNGTWAKGTVGDLVATSVLGSVEYDSDTELEDITPATGLVKNYVLIRDEFTLTVEEVKLANQANNISLAAYGGFDYFLVTVKTSPDAGTTLYYVQAIIVRASIRDPYGANKTMNTLTGRSCGLPIAIQAATPLWT